MKESVYGVIHTGTKEEVKLFDKTMQELKELKFIPQSMGCNDFVQSCFQIGYNQYLKEIAQVEETIS